MRLQVRIGEQFSELLNHLESIKPELRGKRLLALAAMQLARSESCTPTVLKLPDQTPSIEIGIPSAPAEVLQPRTKRAPDWIKRNANS